MELNPVTQLDFFDWDVALRLGIAAILGLALGLDREMRGHAAGMRTHGLVCFSAAGTTVAMLALYYQLDGARADPLRLFEAIGAFIGIVGAGLIVFSKGKLHNITTAAHLWLTSVIGIGCGAALWPLVAIGTIISLVMITFLRVIEGRFFGPDRTLDEGETADRSPSSD